MNPERETMRAAPLRARLWVEFAVLFLVVPVAHVAFFEVLGPFIPLAAVLAAASVLLTVTPGFRWREIVDARGVTRYLPMVAGLLLFCIAVIFTLVLILIPDRLFGFPRHDPEGYALVIALYPFLSVLGQEIAYRLLFFRRYRRLFPDDHVAILMSAAVFALAHTFFLNWVAVTLTFAGGLVFAWAYARSGSFPLVWILHTLAGWVIFTSGLGTFFYHGAIPG